MPRLRPLSDHRRGLFISIDGPSRAGKSTLVRHLAQLLVASPRHGRAFHRPHRRIGPRAERNRHRNALARLYAADRCHHVASRQGFGLSTAVVPRRRDPGHYPRTTGQVLTAVIAARLGGDGYSWSALGESDEGSGPVDTGGGAKATNTFCRSSSMRDTGRPQPRLPGTHRITKSRFSKCARRRDGPLSILRNGILGAATPGLHYVAENYDNGCRT